MVIIFHDIKGIVHQEFVPTDHTVNSYCGVLWTCEEKKPDLWERKIVLLHHDNVPPLRALNDQQFLTKNNMNVDPDPPYLLDLAPCNFFLFL